MYLFSHFLPEFLFKKINISICALLAGGSHRCQMAVVVSMIIFFLFSDIIYK
jgi:hypothetical protein